MRLSSLASTALLTVLVLAMPLSHNAAQEKSLPRAIEAIDGHSLRLTDGTVLRLAGILAPDAHTPAERRAAEEARKSLEALAIGHELIPLANTDRRDRHDRRLLHIGRGDGKWLQGELLQAGLARVWTQPDATERSAEMLKLESEARQARRGIWGLPYFAILTPETATAALDRFQLVEFTVAEVARVRGTVYLNAGADWRSDFTARLERDAAKLFTESGQDLMGLKGKTLRVRGWLRLYNGPFMEITHPQQIEIVER